MFSWLTRTDPADVARVESRTFVVTTKRSDAIPNRMDGVAGQLGNWMSPDDLPKAIQDRFPNCMKGKKKDDIFMEKFLTSAKFNSLTISKIS